jgi:hypothetical protein
MKSSEYGRTLFVSAVVALLMVDGCGGSYTPSSGSPAPKGQDVQIAGQYDLTLRSSKLDALTSIYTNFSQAGATLAGVGKTLVCPSNDLSKCIGSDQSNSIVAHGTVSGQDVAITISFSGSAGDDTVTLTGSAASIIGSGAYRLSGTYTDSLGDAGVWIGSRALYPFGPNTGQRSYSGTFNSTANPLTITPTITLVMAGDANANLSGTAVIMNWPCGSSITLSGQAMGDAFVVSDSQNKVSVIGLPVAPAPAGNAFKFSYKYDPAAPSCPGDFGQGTLTASGSPWDY